MAKFRLHRKMPWARSIYTRLDEARRERDGLAAEIRSLATELDKITRERDSVLLHGDRLKSALRDQFRTLLTEPDHVSLPSTPTGETQSLYDPVDDAKIIERIIAAYKLAAAAAPPPTDSIWEQSFFDLKRDVHEALIESDPAAARDLLRDPSKTELLYGFENLTRSQIKKIGKATGVGQQIYFDLLLLSEAIGARRLWFPEFLAGHQDYVESFPDVEALLICIDEHIGFRVTFPNPFAGEIGLSTTRGIASYRAVQSLYQAWLVASLVRGTDRRVLDIGAGTGRTAFYARQFGITDYTIIDIPMTNVAQSNFLSRALGEDAVALFGEKEDRSRIRILPSAAFFNSDDKYDLAMNVDSLPEMALETARSYCFELKKRAKKFLSINHEYGFIVRDACAEAGFLMDARHPYCMRRGHVEEVFKL